MFDITNTVIEKTEALILKHSYSKRLSWFNRYLVFPLNFLWLGVSEFLNPMRFCSILVFIFLMLGAFLIKILDLSPETTVTLYYLSFFIPMALVVFAVPSTYSYSGVDKFLVNKVVEILQEEKVSSVDDVNLLLENLEKVYSRTSSRVSFYKWFLGSLWAIYVMYLNFILKASSHLEKISFVTVIEENIMFLLLFSLVSICTLLFIASYKCALEKLIKSIEFGCVELKYQSSRNDSIL